MRLNLRLFFKIREPRAPPATNEGDSTGCTGLGLVGLRALVGVGINLKTLKKIKEKGK